LFVLKFPLGLKLAYTAFYLISGMTYNGMKMIEYNVFFVMKIYIKDVGTKEVLT
jgi:hypothetical protein